MKMHVYITIGLFFTIAIAGAQVMLDAEGDAKINNEVLICDGPVDDPNLVGRLYGEYLGNSNTGNNLTLANDPTVPNSFADINISSNDRIYLETNGSRRLTVSPSGAVGIGTESPSKLLHVLDDAVFGGGSTDFSSASEHIRLAAQSDNWYVGALNESTIAASDFTIGLSSGASGMFHIENGGDVGIGTANPIAKLHLQDEGHQLVIRNDDDQTNTWYVGASAPNWLTGENHLVFDDDGNTSLPILCLHGTEEAVSIGTSYASPGYKLAVNGAIITEEVRVDLRNDWPDYVFADNYQLMSLPDVEKAINENGHLPGIPSADEIAENGLHLGDMQKRMMEKIEELTLHVIALNKEIEQLKADR